MTTRERVLSMVVLGVVIVAGLAVVFHQFVFAALQERDASLTALRKTVNDKQQELATKQGWMQQKLAEKPRLAYWKQLSLPANRALSQRDPQKYLSELQRHYENYLSELLDSSGFASGYRINAKAVESKAKPGPASKAPLSMPVIFTVEEAHADLASLVKMLERFYRTSLMHQIKNLEIKRPETARQGQKPGTLDVKFTIEALILTGAEDRPELVPTIDPRLAVVDTASALQGGPVGLAQLPWAIGPTGPLGPGHLAAPPRRYVAMAGKNIFFGKPPAPERRPVDEVNVTRFVYLTDITHGGKEPEAWLYDRYNKRHTRLRGSAGFNTFRIRDNEGETLLRGKVLRIQDRDLVFQVDESYYSLHVGQSLKEAMEKALKGKEIEELGLTAPEE